MDRSLLMRVGLVGAALCASGCSLLLDVDDYRGVEIVAEEVELGAAVPTRLLEATGASSTRPGVLFFEGKNLTADAVISADRADLEILDKRVSENGRYLALVVRVAVMPELLAGEGQTIVLTLEQAGTSVSQSIEIDGLPELTLDAGDSPFDPAAADLDALYSRVEITAPLTLVGSAALELRARSAILVDGHLLAPGQDAAGISAGDGGGPGCGGGAGAEAAPCERGGATAVTALLFGDGGGGGGGFVGGQAGGGQGGSGGDGLGGDPFTSPALLSGHGGGGGGNGGLGLGGGGGGGGGVVLLDAPLVDIAGRIDVSGGAGGEATGSSCTVLGRGGGGGGGSGGGIVIRAQTLSADLAELDARGGAGGSGCGDGGAGGDGLIRIDAPPSQLASTGATPPARLGPRWAVSEFLWGESVSLAFTAQAESSVGIIVDGERGDDAVADGTGTGLVELELDPGVHDICLLVHPNASLDDPDAVDCLSVAVVPEL